MGIFLTPTLVPTMTPTIRAGAMCLCRMKRDDFIHRNTAVRFVLEAQRLEGASHLYHYAVSACDAGELRLYDG